MSEGFSLFEANPQNRFAAMNIAERISAERRLCPHR
jgi:hypothetical protein